MSENMAAHFLRMVFVFLAVALIVGARAPSSHSAPIFAPVGARYVVGTSSPELTAEILTTDLTTDLIASSPVSNLGSPAKPWGNVFVAGNASVGGSVSSVAGVNTSGSISAAGAVSAPMGQFGNLIANALSAVGADQSISLTPSGSGKVIVGGDSVVVAPKASAPANPQTGQIYFDTALGVFRGFDGSRWVNLSFPRLLFIDDFNRPDSPTVGNGWLEFSTGTGNESCAIAANQLRCPSNENSAGMVEHEFLRQTDIIITADFSFSKLDSDGSGSGLIVFKDPEPNASGTGEWGWFIGTAGNPADGFVEFLNSGPVLFPMQAQTLYHVEAVINADYSGELRIWTDGNPRPSAPTATATAHTPLQGQGVNDVMQFYNNWNGPFILPTAQISLDNFRIETQ